MAGYTYDGLGRRVSISTRTQVYSQAGQLLYGTRQSGTTAQATRYIYLAGKAIAEVNSSTGTTYLHTDALGSVVATVGQLPASLSYSCAAGWTLAGNTCTQATSSTIAATVSGYTCPAGYTLSGSTCAKTTTTTSAATPVYSCAAGWTLSGSSCSLTTSSAAMPVYACPAGWSLSGSTCSGTSTTAANKSWDCKAYGSPKALSWSPSGYYCTTKTVNIEAYDGCPDFAPTYGLQYLGWRQNGANTVACYFGPVAVYSCPAGAALSGSTCSAPTTQAASVSGYTCSSGTLSGSSCLTTSTQAASVSYSCAPGQTLSGTTCSSSSTASTPGTPVYGCPAGYTLSGASCTQQGTATTAATASLSCTSGTLSGVNCLGTLRRTRYEAYGSTAAGAVPAGLGFTGHVNDADIGLVSMQQRYYDPIAARFMSVDPIVTDANTGSMFNRYGYANNNPYRYIDPDGRCTGSNITNKDGTCKSSGGFTTGSAGILEGMERGRLGFGPAAAPSPAAGAASGETNSAAPLINAIEGISQVYDFLNQPTGLCAEVRCNMGTVPSPMSMGRAKAISAVAGGGAKVENLTAAEALRIQNAANRTGTEISVVGSHASGTARPTSDWDYVVPVGTSRSTVHSLSGSLPAGPRSLGEPRNQDFFREALDLTRPHITFTPN